ncbi:hypothetical protein [Anaeromyxobacter sp. PSR-1]|uniref:hypothetical protein n=1 Tax=Anaeromyxobacter sp. PSR-1 TaxID=1300915 RepID=UPI0005E9B69A|nr:hypothetical protein [Anaeromyxobacter sp. PSR-1]GAO04005.1 hypothetical protein PSR1_02893 [Anaeromyxobacter sp. PSR-1]
MLRLEESVGALDVTSRLARPRALAVLALALLGAAWAARAALPALAGALAVAAALLAILGGRAVRARVAGGIVSVRPAAPFAAAVTRPLAAYGTAAVETVADARRRRAEALARGYAARAGAELPSWLAPRTTPGTHDHLRRIVLLPVGAGEPLAVTAWLPPEDDLEPLRRALAARLA